MICSDSKISVPNRIFDLWLNAERCAARGRFDDATSRVYRLLEWCSQWMLQHYKNIDTADISESEIPPTVRIPYNERKGVYMASLVQSWDLAAAVCGDSAANFWKRNRDTVLNLLEIRNNSILAHGYEPISQTNWHEIYAFYTSELLPFMLEEFKVLKISRMPEQLPREWSE